LTTDFGVVDGYVGTVHGVVLREAPAARIVDLCHAVKPQHVLGGAFHLRHAWRHFGPGTIHVAVIDPGVGSGRRILALDHGGQYFLAPDNGLLAAALGSAALREAAASGALTTLEPARVSRGPVSATFHARDLFAPAAAALVRGVARAALGSVCTDPVLLDFPSPEVAGRHVRAEVLHIDHFGNAISSFAPAQVAFAPAQVAFEPSAWRALVGGRSVPCVTTYADVPSGALLALVDSFGHLELAVRDGHAARELRLDLGSAVEFERLH